MREIEDGAIVTRIVKQRPHLAALVEVRYPVHAPQVSHIENSGGRAKIVKIQTAKPERNLEVTMLQVLDQDGNIIGFMKILHDITKEVLLEKMKDTQHFQLILKNPDYQQQNQSLTMVLKKRLCK